MSIVFDGDYYSGTGYKEYANYPHFADRAAWIITEYNNRVFVNDIWVIGAGWGWLVKEIRDLLPTGEKAKCKGIVFSQYEKDRSIDTVGLVDGAIILEDITDYIFPDMDMAVSWNFLDSLPQGNDVKITGVTAKLINRAKFQMHVICMDTNDPNADSYIAEGYSIETRAYWRTKFDTVDFTAGQRCFLVNYATGNVSRKIDGDWENSTGNFIPTSWGRVSL